MAHCPSPRLALAPVRNGGAVSGMLLRAGTSMGFTSEDILARSAVADCGRSRKSPGGVSCFMFSSSHSLLFSFSFFAPVEK